jgi:hypothetical protein
MYLPTDGARKSISKRNISSNGIDHLTAKDYMM